MAEGYGMDLDREAARGMPADGIGHRDREESIEPVSMGEIVGIVGVLALGTFLVLMFFRTYGYLARAVGLAPSSTSHFIEETYSTMTQAAGAGRVNPMVMPPHIPAHGRNIHLRVAKMGGEGWIALQAPTEEVREMVRDVPPIANERLQSFHLSSPKRPWWPSDLESQLRTGLRDGTWRLYGPVRIVLRSYEFIAWDLAHDRLWIWREKSN